MAGEIKTGYPKKNVTLIHNQSLPINDRLGLKARQAMKVGLEKLGVKLILDDSVVFPEGGLGNGRQRRILTTARGVQVESDLQFVSFGVVPNSDIVSNLDPSLINPESHSIRVRPTLQLPGYDNIFALGDVADTDETKLAFRAGMHADIVAKNILALTKKAPLKDYKKITSEVMLVTLGKNGGVAAFPLGITAGECHYIYIYSFLFILPFFHLTGFFYLFVLLFLFQSRAGNMISRSMKSGNLMIDRTWKLRYGSIPK